MVRRLSVGFGRFNPELTETLGTLHLMVSAVSASQTARRSPIPARANDALK